MSQYYSKYPTYVLLLQYPRTFYKTHVQFTIPMSDLGVCITWNVLMSFKNLSRTFYRIHVLFTIPPYVLQYPHTFYNTHIHFTKPTYSLQYPYMFWVCVQLAMSQCLLKMCLVRFTVPTYILQYLCLFYNINITFTKTRIRWANVSGFTKTTEEAWVNFYTVDTPE